ncbi:hypothetical protein GYA54_03490 [Candidatus Kuenenbacteria bacterium]|nr:hypothetical protein [Candidatus Kuenenbacteria bacterium]
MSGKIEQLKNIIQNHAGIESSDKEKLIEAVAKLNDQAADYLIFLAENNPENLARINQYFKAKSEVFATQDPEKIKSFLDKHYRELLDEASQEEN